MKCIVNLIGAEKMGEQNNYKEERISGEIKKKVKRWVKKRYNYIQAWLFLLVYL